jgi:U3 small nucleolar RNA-associated protein 14
VLKPLSYTEGIGLLDHELDGLRIYEDIEQFVQNAMEVSSQSNTDGQNVEDVIGDIMSMVTNFGFNLLYDATLHTNGSEEHMDPEWIVQMYNNDDGSDDDSSMNDDDSNSESDDSESDSESDHESSDDGRDDESENKRIVLPEVPESLLE